ncbi:MBL fold metallo-hydrolase [Streptomyces sp. 549]|uniref:MBL fold metallo-hydrolase n=1 Tax=Streptomyces sp. 549 TaxID=3049076 RepID=UPI0032E36271
MGAVGRTVAGGVYAYEQPPGGWCVSNAGLVVGDGAAVGGDHPNGPAGVLVDTAATEARARRLRQEVERICPGGPAFVVNTHFHGDHTFGHAQFTPRAQVVAAAGRRAEAAEAGLGLRGLWPDAARGGDTQLTLPAVTFRDRLTLHTGGLRVELLDLGPAHTANDTVVWVPDRRVVFNGDLVWPGVTPYLLMGSVTGSLRALDRPRELGCETVVPGHGPVAGPELLDQTESYLRWIERLAEEGHRSGLTRWRRRGGPSRAPSPNCSTPSAWWAICIALSPNCAVCHQEGGSMCSDRSRRWSSSTAVFRTAVPEHEQGS